MTALRCFTVAHAAWPRARPPAPPLRPAAQSARPAGRPPAPPPRPDAAKGACHSSWARRRRGGGAAGALQADLAQPLGAATDQADEREAVLRGAPGKSMLCCSHVGSHRHRMRPSCALSARAVPGEQWCSERWGARQCPDLGPERGSGARSNCCERAGWGRWRRARQRRARRTRCCSRWTRITRAAACGAPCWTSWARCGARGRTQLHFMQGRALSSMLHCVGRCKEALCVKM